MTAFFTEIKNAVGILESKTIMSDDLPACYDTLCNVIEQPELLAEQHCLLCCFWHVLICWKKNLNKVKDKLKKAQVYQVCNTMLHSENLENLVTHINKFIEFCCDADLRAFGSISRGVMLLAQSSGPIVTELSLA